MKKSKITGITQKAKNSVDKSESSINRFARFMGVMTKSVTKDIPDQKTLKKAGLFAKNFGGGRSSKVNKMLLGGALMLPLVLGQMLSKERSTEELLQNQYGGNEKAMQSDLSEEQKIRDEGLEKVETTADENKDISLDRKKDLQAVSQKDPEEIPKSEVDSDDTTLERMNDKLSSVDEGIDKKNSDQFVELMDRFVFLAKVGAFNVDKGPTLSERIDQTKANVRKFTGGKVDDGVFSLGFGINIPNVFSDKGRQKLGLGSKDNSKDQQSRIQEINDSVDAQIAKNEKAYADAGSLLANEEATKKYLRTKSELEKLKKRLQDEPLTVLTEMMSDANPSSVSSQSSMLSLGGSDGTVPTKVADDLDFQRGVDKLAQKYNISVQDLYAVMSFESGGTFDPAQKNIGYDGTPETGSGATGLIQFMPDTAKERARKNIEEGRGVSVGGLVKGRMGSTTYEFSTSNPMWRASLETLDFLPLTTVDYSGGVIITDWYSENQNEAIKVTIRFLSNEIRSYGINIKIFYQLTLIIINSNKFWFFFNIIFSCYSF